MHAVRFTLLNNIIILFTFYILIIENYSITK